MISPKNIKLINFAVLIQDEQKENLVTVLSVANLIMKEFGLKTLS